MRLIKAILIRIKSFLSPLLIFRLSVSLQKQLQLNDSTTFHKLPSGSCRELRESSISAKDWTVRQKDEY